MAQNPTKQILIAAIISTILALLISYFSIKADAQIQYFEDLESLLEEMQINYESICNFPKIVEERCVEWEKNGIWKWMPKESSYTNWGDGQNFHLKYCKSSAYFNFVNKGHIMQNYNITIPTENIAHFYQFCIEFSIELQIIENHIRNPQQLVLASDNSTTTSSHTYTTDFPVNRIEGETTQFNYKIRDKTLSSKREVCDFLKNEFYKSYAFKNDLNEGILDEYKNTTDILKKYFNPKDVVSDKMMEEKHPETKSENLSNWSYVKYGLGFALLFAIFFVVLITLDLWTSGQNWSSTPQILRDVAGRAIDALIGGIFASILSIFYLNLFGLPKK